MDEFRTAFCLDMQVMFPRGIQSPEQLRLMIHIYALGWGKSLFANGMQNAGEQFLKLAEVSLNVPGWTPDDSWRWWLTDEVRGVRGLMNDGRN